MYVEYTFADPEEGIMNPKPDHTDIFAKSTNMYIMTVYSVKRNVFSPPNHLPLPLSPPERNLDPPA